MRALTRSLGPIRELDVELDILEDESKTEGAPGRAIEMVRREMASRRQALRDELDRQRARRRRQEADQEARAAREGAKATGQRERQRAERRRRLEAQWRGVLATRLMRRAKSVWRARSNSAGPLYAPERLHDVRISTKKLRYALEIARDAGVTAATRARANPEATAGTARRSARSADAVEARPRSGSVARCRFASERPDGVCRFARARVPPAARRLRRASRRARRRSSRMSATTSSRR